MSWDWGYITIISLASIAGVTNSTDAWTTTLIVSMFILISKGLKIMGDL